MARSREFSKGVKRRCGGGDKKMKMGEIKEMAKEAAQEYYVVTPEMVTLNEHIQKAINW